MNRGWPARLGVIGVTMSPSRTFEFFLLLVIGCCCRAYLFECPASCESVECPATTSCGNPYKKDECGCCGECWSWDGDTCGGHDNAGGDCLPGSYCAYRIGVVFGERREGICEPNICKTRDCGYRQHCVSNGSCVCPEYELCEEDCNPVYGNDGRLYQSIYHLQREECLTNRFIGVWIGNSVPTALQAIGSKDNFDEYSSIDTMLHVLQYHKRMLWTNDLHEPKLSHSGGCVFKNRFYPANTFQQAEKKDPCHYLQCLPSGTVRLIDIPGCQGHIPNMDDLHVQVQEDFTESLGCEYSTWSAWSPCSFNCLTERTRMMKNSSLSICSLYLSQRKKCRNCSDLQCQLRLKSSVLMLDNCVSIDEFPVPYCSGLCVNTTDCCRPSSYYIRQVPVQCPGKHYYEDKPLDSPEGCKCQTHL